MKNKVDKNIALILVTYNQKDITAKTIGLLLEKQTVVPDIIVVDNFSTDRTKEFIEKRFPTVTVLRTKGNYGGSGGYYIGSKYAYKNGYEWIIMSDNDAIPISNNLIEELVKNASENVVTQPWNISEDFKKRYNFWFFHYICANRVVFKKIGFPMFNFFIYGDEVEFSERLRNNKFALKKLSDVSYSHPIKRLINPNLFYFEVRNKLYIMNVYSNIFHSLINIIILMNSLFIYKYMGEVNYFKSGIKGFKDFLLGNFDNSFIRTKLNINGNLKNCKIVKFKDKYEKAFININYKSNIFFNFKKNMFQKTKSIRSIISVLRNEYSIQESLVSNESLLLSFWSNNIVCLDDVDKDNVKYRIYPARNLFKKMIFMIVYNVLYCPLIIVILCKMIFTNVSKNVKNDLNDYIE